MRFKKEYYLAAVFFAVGFNSCKKWDDAQVSNPALTQTLSVAIAADPALSKFSEYLQKTGTDVVLQSSKTFTVWAPTNDALQSLDPAIVSDTAKLRSFVLNHIASQTYSARDAQTSIRVAMLNGKYNNFFGNKFEDANIVTAGKFQSNGVLHVIDKAILVLPNAWDFITATTAQYLQNNFIAGLNFTAFDPSLATIDSIRSSTGLPVYHPGTGLVLRNSFNDRVSDLKREDKQFTYFVIANAAFTSKADSLKPYYKTSSATTTDSLDKWNIVKDLVVDTLYPTPASLPNIIISKFGIAVPVNKASIIDTKKVSNGIVYVLSSSDAVTAAKFQQKIMEGELPSGFFSDKSGNTNYRIKRNPATGQNFSDILVTGHGVTAYFAYYRFTEMPSMKYNVYVTGVNDFQTAATFQSINPVYFTAPSAFTPLPAVSIQLPANTTQLSYPVPLSLAAGGYNEVFLGSFNSNLYGTFDLRLTSAGTTIGSSGTGPIVLDYLRIVPVP